MDSISPSFFLKVRDQSFNIVALFDSWNSLSYMKKVNSVYTYTLVLNSDDPRSDLFELDGLVELWREVPGCNISAYQEFIGLHRSIEDQIMKDKTKIITLTGVGLNDLLARTIINYPPATVKSYKNTASETAMKEYVEENCGSLATLAEGRESLGVFPFFSVEADGGHGDLWEGDRAWENLLEVLQDIARFSEIDFNVEWDSLSEEFVFKTYVGQYGEDRTIQGLDPVTGLNSAGNAPVIFSLERGNLSSIIRAFDRISESNVVTVLGDGDGATVDVQVRSTLAIVDSPWNRREICRSKAGFVSEMQIYGDEILTETSAKDILTFSPLLQPSCMYGKHYFLGDKVSILFKGAYYSLRIYSVSNPSVGTKESLTMTFSELQ